MMETITKNLVKERIREVMLESFDITESDITPSVEEKMEKFAERIMSEFEEHLNYLHENYEGVEEYEEILDEVLGNE